MFGSHLRLKSFVAMSLIAVACLLGNVATAAPAKTITFGWTACSDAEFVTKLAKDLVQKHYGYEVNLTPADIGLPYAGVAKGCLDGMLRARFSDIHRAYWEKVGTQVWDLGPLYTDAKLGWEVTDYVPPDQLDSIENLKKPAVRSKLGGSIQCIDPAAGLMQLSDKAIKEYGRNNYDLISASGAAMTATLAPAERLHKWIVVTGWTPHGMFGRWKLRFLKDIKGVLGGPQHVDVVMRNGFTQDYPHVSAFLARMYIPLGQLQQAMYEAQKASYERAVRLRNGASLPYPLLVHG